MKCSICGHRANTIKAMGAHYRKKHPGAMKAKTHRPRLGGGQRTHSALSAEGHKFCPYCGEKL